MSNGGSKVVTAIIAFLLGFIFAILVEIGAIFGVYAFVTSASLDTILGAIGVNNKDGDDYIYINTDSSNGGAGTVGELLEMLKGYLFSDGSTMDFPVLGKSLDDIGNLLPIVQRTLAEKLYPVVEEYVDIEWDEFEKIPLTEMPQFLSETVMSIRPAKLLEKLGMSGLVGEDANVIVSALLAGAEFEYATTSDGLKFPVYYDTYVYDDGPGDYYRTESADNQSAFPHNIPQSYLYDADVKTANGDKEYRLYFIPCRLKGSTLSDAQLSDDKDHIYDANTTFLAVRYDVDGDEYVLDLSDISAIEYPDYYGLNNLDRTGNFYYTNGGEEMQVYPVTLATFSDPDEVFKSLNCLRITQLMDGDIIAALFGTHTVGELIDGKLDIDSCVSNLTLAKVMSVDPENSLMAYLGYGLTGVKGDGHGGYSGFVDVDGVSTECTVVVENNEIKRVYYINGSGEKVEVAGTKVSEVADVATGMEITAFIDVKADDAILAYLGYGVSQVSAEEGDGYTHTGKYDVEQGSTSVEVDAYISTDAEGYVTAVWYYTEGGEKVNVRGTTIDGISDRISSLTDKLTLPSVLDIKADHTITMYIGYGISGVKPAEEGANGYAYTGKFTPEGADDPVECYIATDGDDKVTSAWYFVNGAKKYLRGTPVSKLSDKIDGISNELTLGDVMDISKEDTIMWALRESKICDLGKDVKNLKVGDVIEINESSSPILRQLKNKSINELSTAIDAISIQSIYAKEIYGAAAGGGEPEPHVHTGGYDETLLYFTRDEDGAFIYVHDGEEGKERGFLTAEEFESYGEGKLYTYGASKGMWRLILMVDDGVKHERVYTLNDFGSMVQSCTQNINNAKLGTLQEAGIIDGGADLKKTLVWGDGPDQKAKLEDLTLKELINVVVNMAK